MSDAIEITVPEADEIQQLRQTAYNATIVERIDVHTDLARFRIRPDEPVAPFEPGQYVAIGLGNWEPRLPGTQAEPATPDKIRKLGRRAYSISCPMVDASGKVAPVDSIDYLEFYVTLVRASSDENAKPPLLTPRLFLLREGDRVEMQRKIVGHYVLGDIDPDDTILMLGTGTGEAPHNAMTAKLLANQHRGRIVNVTSVRSQADLGYAAEHARLMSDYPQYKYLYFTTRDPENLDRAHPKYVGKQYLQSLFQTGRLAELAGDPLSPTNTHAFLCGNPAMIGYVPPGADPPATPGMLQILREAGFTDDHDAVGAGSIRFEKYW